MKNSKITNSRIPQILSAFAFLYGCLLLQGCAPIVVGGAVATGAAVAHDRRTTGTVIEDQAIELKIKKAILEDKSLAGKTHINVTSFNNYVLLTGEAPTEELRQKAYQIAKRTPKVSHVFNEITIAAPSSLTARSSDTLLTANVKSRLLADKNVDGTRIKVVTEAGVVYLMGIVTRGEGNRAALIASKVSGVQKVVKLFQYKD